MGFVLGLLASVPILLLGTPLHAQSGGFVYVTNGNSLTISAFSIDATTGMLTSVRGSPFPSGGGFVTSIAVHPSGQLAYTSNLQGINPGTVSAFTIEADGVLTSIPGSPFGPAGDGPWWAAVDPTGQFVYIADTRRPSGRVFAFSISADTGALTAVPGSPFPSGAFPWSVAVDPTGRFAYVANGYSNDVWAYSINPDTGALTAIDGSPFPAELGSRSVVVDGAGRFAYVANCGDFECFGAGSVSVYNIDNITGVLTQIEGSPFRAGIGSRSMVLDPLGRFAYVANYASATEQGNVSGYTVDADTGALTEIPGSPFPAGNRSLSVAVDPSGQFAYVVNQGSTEPPPNLSAFTIDGTSGALTEIAGSPYPVGLSPTSVTTTAGPLVTAAVRRPNP